MEVIREDEIDRLQAENTALRERLKSLEEDESFMICKVSEYAEENNALRKRLARLIEAGINVVLTYNDRPARYSGPEIDELDQAIADAKEAK
jgi:predicted nuclease with TOPRIM domain